MKKIILGIVVLTVVFLSGCSADAEHSYVLNEESYKMTQDVGTSDTVEQTPVNNDSSGGEISDFSDNPVLANRKIIYIANLRVLADDPNAVYDLIINKLVIYDAYIEEEVITETRYEITIRVLSANMMDFINDIKDNGELVSYSKTSQDITNAYSTFEARKLALETQHVRILELIEIAIDLDDILTLEAERIDIESELNEIGLKLTNYDSLVDYSTINLVMVKTENVIELLPRSDKPYLQVEDYDTSSISVKVFNRSENTASITLVVKENGVLVESFEQDAYGISYLEFELTNLDADTSYTFEIYSQEDDHSVSLSNLSTITTNKTYFIKVADVFVISYNTLVSVGSFLGLAVTALAPFAVVGSVLYFPSRVVYLKKIKPNMRVRKQNRDSDTKE
ncbi:MAG: DUF4349 domain-containing protein [Candidatus Izimaplasma sp.]|nr:DUF4349 domain-containing protein [Candidatus Izimaplasma bacterium]